MYLSSVINKKTLLLTLSLLLTSLPLIHSTPKSNLRILDDTKDCWVAAYGRGVGKPISVCPSGYEQGGELCYPPCQAGYTGDGPVCWENCPSGFKNTGGECLKPSSYGRGSGYVAWHEAECNSDNSQGCEKYGLVWYPKCAESFYAYDCCVCSPKCPSGMTDIGVSCQKNKYGRTGGKPLVCKPDEVEDAGLCYPPCKEGYNGIGPVCWGSCPAGMYKCAALCTESGENCGSDVFNIAEQILKALITLATEGEDIFDLAKAGVNLISEFTKYPICSNS